VRPDPPWRDPDVLPGTDITKTRAYTESYRYDNVGNLLELAHVTPTVPGAGFTRSYTLAAGNNQLAQLDTGGKKTADYTYDACGNLTTETDSRLLEWDHAHRLVTFRTQPTPATEPSVYAQYRYDATGTRIAKLVRSQNGPTAITIFLGGFERILTLSTQGETATRHDITHITDGAVRIAEIHAGDPLRKDGLAGNPVRYQHADHLTSVAVATSDIGEQLNREEYSPYGETTFGSYTRKRYRYTGKERDEESSLNYHGARHYAPWLGRWTSCDPAGYAETLSPYTYTQDRPSVLLDPSGSRGIPLQDLQGFQAPTLPGTAPEVPPEIPPAIGPLTVAYLVARILEYWVKFNLKVQEAWRQDLDARVRRANESQDWVENGWMSPANREDYIRSGVAIWRNASAGGATAAGPPSARSGTSSRDPVEAGAKSPRGKGLDEGARLGGHQRTMAALSIERSGLAPPPGASNRREYTLKSAISGKTVYQDPEARSGSRRPDVNIAAEGGVGTIETKYQFSGPTDPVDYVQTHPEAAEQLTKEAWVMSTGPIVTGTKNDPVPVVGGWGIGLATGYWVWYPPANWKM
jgi:RHS repeat-associated protein